MKSFAISLLWLIAVSWACTPIVTMISGSLFQRTSTSYDIMILSKIVMTYVVACTYRMMNEPRVSARILYCKRWTCKDWERDYSFCTWTGSHCYATVKVQITRSANLQLIGIFIIFFPTACFQQDSDITWRCRQKLDAHYFMHNLHFFFCLNTCGQIT